jgi:hypothetical protein
MDKILHVCWWAETVHGDSKAANRSPVQTFPAVTASSVCFCYKSFQVAYSNGINVSLPKHTQL